MPDNPLRLLIAAYIVVVLGRAGVGAWRHRGLTLAIWRGVRARHVVGALLLLVGVAGVGMAMLAWVPPLRVGLGDLVGFNGNAVFVPLEEAAQRAGPAPTSGPDWVLIGLSSAFLVPLALLLPWLAFLEEEIFRAGLEHASRRREVVAALVFGLVHLVMLVPIAAALAVGCAGYVYGRVYRAAYAASDGRDVPWVALSSYRSSRRARQAAQRTRVLEASRLGLDPEAAYLFDRTPERRQAAGVFAAATIHATFNTLVVALLYVAIVLDAL